MVLAVGVMVSAGCESKESEKPKAPAAEKPAAEKPVEAAKPAEAAEPAKPAEEAKPTAAKPAEAAEPAADAPAAGASAVEAKLAAADALDGKVDKIVTRCGGCKLGMDGKAELAFETHGYTMHFCTPDCRERFAKDTEKEVLALTIPSE